MNHQVKHPIVRQLFAPEANLIVDPANLAAVVPTYRMLINNITFNAGGKYEEFRAGDKVAEYTLATLVTGGAAVATIKLWKQLIAVVAGILALFGAAGKKIKSVFAPRQPATVGVGTSPEPPPAPIITCPHCGQRNRISGGRTHRPTCAKCHTPLSV